jgi:hypothetical protein
MKMKNKTLQVFVVLPFSKWLNNFYAIGVGSMKKIFLKSIVFFACLAVGGLPFWSSGYLIGNAEGGSENALQPPSVIDTTPSMIETTVEKKRGKGLEVRVKEIVDTGQGLAVDFEITNFEDESYFYNSYEQTTNAEPIFLLYSVKINGKEENLGGAGPG